MNRKRKSAKKQSRKLKKKFVDPEYGELDSDVESSDAIVEIAQSPKFVLSTVLVTIGTLFIIAFLVKLKSRP